MSSNRSQKAAHYGALAERAAFDRYDLTANRDGWHDCLDESGDPWDVKAAMLNRRAPRFRLWKDQHRRLVANGGGYVFVGYVPVGRGIRVRRMKAVRASSLKLSFYGAGSHQKGLQFKIHPSRVFSST